jgi:hypothetical protein
MEQIKAIEKIIDEAKESIASGEAFDHGYPEARLLPSDFTQQCVEATIDDTLDKIREYLVEYLYVID